MRLSPHLKAQLGRIVRLPIWGAIGVLVWHQASLTGASKTTITLAAPAVLELLWRQFVPASPVPGVLAAHLGGSAPASPLTAADLPALAEAIASAIAPKAVPLVVQGTGPVTSDVAVPAPEIVPPVVPVPTDTP